MAPFVVFVGSHSWVMPTMESCNSNASQMAVADGSRQAMRSASLCLLSVWYGGLVVDISTLARGDSSVPMGENKSQDFKLGIRSQTCHVPEYTQAYRDTSGPLYNFVAFVRGDSTKT